MENQTQEKRFIYKNFDKFKNRTDTSWNDPQSGKVFGAKWGKNWSMDVGYGEDRSTQEFNLKLRHVKSPESDSIVIDYDWWAKDWFFVRNGKMIVNIDGIDNIELEPHESDTSVGKYGGTKLQELGFYNISKEQLKQICDAKEISVKISGGSSYFELEDKGLLKFHFMCRSFYADLYEDSSYDEWINSIIPPGSEKKGGCFIATAAMGDYNHPVVMDLRLFRDNWLLKRDWGVQFTNWYYTHGPKAANIIEKSTFLRKLTFFAIVKPLQILTKRFK
ncbi:hypothetical protein N8010_00565 [Crocinitomicaceae bacterium]|nr:hypothetical protein [Crocinitomicaceae bacterium]